MRKNKGVVRGRVKVESINEGEGSSRVNGQGKMIGMGSRITNAKAT